MSNRETGMLGESIALRYLVDKGYEVVERNYRTRYGEIDLILRGAQALVFVEVKARRGTGFGDPLEAVTPGKQARVRSMRRPIWPNGGLHLRRRSRRSGSMR